MECVLASGVIQDRVLQSQDGEELGNWYQHFGLANCLSSAAVFFYAVCIRRANVDGIACCPSLVRSVRNTARQPSRMLGLRLRRSGKRLRNT